MTTSLYVVHSNPVPGREAEYNEWYSTQHLHDLVAIPGFVRARRFEISGADEPALSAYRYLALYEIEGDPQAAMGNMSDAVTAGMHLSEALSPELLATTYTAITDWIHEPAAPRRG